MWNAKEPKAETKLGSFCDEQSSRTWLAEGEIVGDEWVGAKKNHVEFKAMGSFPPHYSSIL